MKGVWFGDKHSYSDFALILNSKNIPLPEPKTYMVEVPCSDGVLDLSTTMTGGVMKYQNRTIELQFTIMKSFCELESWKSYIASHLHGKVLKVTFDVDNCFYYLGRCKITDFVTDGFPATITIEIDAEPYKYNTYETTISESVSESKIISIEEQKMPVVPTITVSSDMTLTYKTKQIQLFSGKNIIPSIVLSSAENNILEFSGIGDVLIEFRGGEL